MLWVLSEFTINLQAHTKTSNLKSTYLIKSNDQKIVQQPQITFYYYNFDFHIWLPSRKLTTAHVFATLGYKITPSSHKLKLMQHLIQWAR